LAVESDEEMKFLKELGCKVFGHAPAFASLSVPNHCITCKTPMMWNPGTECWDALQVTPEAPPQSTWNDY